MGIQGAAIASVIAEAVSILFFVVYTRLTVDIRKYALNQIVLSILACWKRDAGYFRVHDAAIFLVYRYLVYVLYRCGAFGATGVGGGEYRT